MPPPQPTAARTPPRPSGSSRRIGRLGRLTAIAASAALLLAGCASQPPILSTVGFPADLPEPSCGGVKILIEGALPCDRIVDIAITTLAQMSSFQLGDDILRIDVWLADCQGGAVVPNLDCLRNPFAQFVTVTTGPAAQPRSVVVVIAPVTGEVLGIANAPIR